MIPIVKPMPCPNHLQTLYQITIEVMAAAKEQKQANVDKSKYPRIPPTNPNPI